MLRSFNGQMMVRIYRAGVVLAALILVHSQAHWRTARQPSLISLGQAQKFSPTRRSSRRAGRRRRCLKWSTAPGFSRGVPLNRSVEMPESTLRGTGCLPRRW